MTIWSLSRWCLPHQGEIFTLSLHCWTSSREAANTIFFKSFGMTGQGREPWSTDCKEDALTTTPLHHRSYHNSTSLSQSATSRISSFQVLSQHFLWMKLNLFSLIAECTPRYYSSNNLLNRSCSLMGGSRNFFFYHGFADLLRHIRCPNLVIHTPRSLFARSAIFTG